MVLDYNKNSKMYVYKVRDTLVMLDRDIAALYSVEVKQLNFQAKENEKIPKDSYFRLTADEWAGLRVLNDSFYYDLRKTPPTAYKLESVLLFAFLFRTAKANLVSMQILQNFLATRQFVSKETGKNVSVADLKNLLTMEATKEIGRCSELYDILNGSMDKNSELIKVVELDEE